MDATDKLMQTANKLIDECQKTSAALHAKTVECEKYKRIVKQYEENQESLLKEIELLKALSNAIDTVTP